MQRFPDESQMDRSQDGSEPIRGGSIGLNKILSSFVEAARKDHKPQFHAVLMSAFTIFRNVYNTKAGQTMTELETGFVQDVNLFLEYLDTYLSHVWRRTAAGKQCPVIIYFPTYKHVPKELVRDRSEKTAEMFKKYDEFLKRHSGYNKEIKRSDFTRCFWIDAGEVTYPHKEVARKFREITTHATSLYSSGDPICLFSSVPLDLHIASRLRNIQLLESFTARIRTPYEFKLKLDKSGSVPFYSCTHAVLGDDVLLKPQVGIKIKREILEAAEKEKWYTRSEDDVRSRLAKITDIPVGTLRRYDFV
jgi:hypothetical protein